MEAMTFFFILALCFGFYMAWSIGANDVANAMGTSVGSGALTFKQAVVLAAVFEFAGAVLVGGQVTQTVRKGIVDPTFFAGHPEWLMFGMTAALLASAAWLHLSSHFGQPVSTTHSIIGGLLGFGLIAGGTVKWSVIAKVVMSWFVSPVAGGLIAFFVFRFITKRVLALEHPTEGLRKIAPMLTFFVAFILVLSFIYKGLKNLKLDLSLSDAVIGATVIGLMVSAMTYQLVKRFLAGRQWANLTEELKVTEKVFRYLQIITACYVAFAHGANDVANAIGPLAAVASIFRTGEVTMKVDVPFWLLLLGGTGIVVGLGTYGRKVMETVGNKITEMTPSRGFTAEFAAATTVLICSKLGMPISTTHTLVGSVIGIGFARGIGSVDIQVITKVFKSWIITIPVTGCMTVFFYLIFKEFFG